MDGDGSDNSPGEMPQDDSPPTSPDPSEARDQDPNIGDVLGGSYRIAEQIGFGGMGVIYRATALQTGRTVVVKLMSEERLGDEASVQRFQREARTLSRLDHPNIVTIHEFGVDDDVSYIVMEHVRGTRLDEFVEMNRAVGAEMFAALADQMLEAIGEAHREGLVHRDLKPSNLMLTNRRAPKEVKVLDFGLAKLVSGDEDVTKQENLVGSMPFLAPEQIEGDEIDQRVDVYALGIVFYFMLTGRKPFRGTNASILYDQVHSEPPPLPLHVPNPDAVPHEIFQFVRDCLRKDPEDRPADATVARDRLREVVREKGLTAPSRPAFTGRVGAETADLADDAEVAMEGWERRDSEELEVPPTAQIERPSEGSSQQDDNGPQERSEPENRSRSWSVPAILTTTASLIIVVGGLLVWFGEYTPTNAWMATGAADGGVDTSPTSDATPDAPPLDPKMLERLDGISAQLERHEVQQAERSLQTTIAEMEHPDRYENRISQIERRLHVERLYRAARRARENGNYGDAISKLERVLRLAPEHREASDLLESVRRYARVRVRNLDVDEVAVRVDGSKVGRAPIVTWVTPGKHDVQLERDGDEIWSRTLEVRRGERISLEPKLDAEQPPAPSQPPPETGADDPSATGATGTPSGPPADASADPDDEEADAEATAVSAPSGGAADAEPDGGGAAPPNPSVDTGAAQSDESPGTSPGDTDFGVAPVRSD